jgi:phage/plasmid-like protein (TIGR03299 family)
MPAYFESGFFVREPAWHGLGVVLPDYPDSVEEAMEAAGHLWEVHLKPVFTLETEPYRPVEIADYRAVVRSDTGKVLSVQPETYGTIQNRELWELVEATLGEIGPERIQVESAGVLRDGAEVWVLARLRDAVRVPGDPSETYTYGAFTTTHDGSGALRVYPTQIRIVCWNTYSTARAAAERDLGHIVIRHTKNARERVAAARQILAGMRDDQAAYLELMEELVGIDVSDCQLARFVVDFIPSPPETLISDRVAANVEEARAAILAILDGPTCAGIRNTAYGMLNAATEYLDHVRRARSSETRFRRSLLREEPLKKKALSLIQEIVRAN